MDTIRVLYVDDEPSFVELVSDYLERNDEGIEIVGESRASDGLDRVLADDVDCVVSDYDMPGMDGIEFLGAVRAERPDLPFILYTGKGSETVASEAISEGATDYLRKRSGTGQYELLANRIRNVVEQYRAEQAAQQNRRRLQHLTESTPDCLWMFDRDWEELLFVCGCEAVWDQPRSAIEENPQDSLNAVHDGDRASVEAAMERLSAGEPIDIEYRIRRGDGETAWVWTKGRPVFEEGEVTRVVGFTRDATGRRRRERRLRRYERIVENLPVGVFRTSLDGEFISANDRSLSLLGVDSLDRLQEHTALDFYADPSDREPLVEVVEREGTVEDHLDIETIDGEPLRVEVSFTLVEEGGEEYLDGIVRGVGDRKRRERRLEQAETMFEHAQDALFLVDVEDDGDDDERFVVRRVNPAYERATGLSNEEIRGQTPREVFGDEAGAEIEERYRMCVRQREPLSYSETLPVGGEVAHWETTVAPVTVDGEVVQLVGATRDVTDRELERRRLREQNERFDRLARVVSHDLQTPLEAARGQAELAVEAGDLKHAERALEAIDRVDELREGLAEMLRVRDVVDETEPVDVGTVCRAAWAMVSPPDRARLEVGDLPELEADPEAAERLFENLLSNAVDHGGNDVTVRVEPTADGFRVADDGPGIPADEREQVFQLGYTTGHDGSGVGLVSVRQIVAAHGWTVAVGESADGGASFEIGL